MNKRQSDPNRRHAGVNPLLKIVPDKRDISSWLVSGCFKNETIYLCLQRETNKPLTEFIF